MTHSEAGPKIVQAKFTVLNDKGLHTRPATELVKCTTRFKANFKLTHHDITVNGKSLLGILMLAAGRGSKIAIEVEGEDADSAATALVSLAENRFNIDY